MTTKPKDGKKTAAKKTAAKKTAAKKTAAKKAPRKKKKGSISFSANKIGLIVPRQVASKSGPVTISEWDGGFLFKIFKKGTQTFLGIVYIPYGEKPGGEYWGVTDLFTANPYIAVTLEPVGTKWNSAAGDTYGSTGQGLSAAQVAANIQGTFPSITVVYHSTASQVLP